MTPREKLDLLRGYRAAGGTGSYVSLIEEAKQYADGGILEKPIPQPSYNEPATATTGMTGMMKARMAYASEFGNPTARRMTNMDGRSYTFTGDEDTGEQVGAQGNVYVSSWDNLVTPQIQDVNNKLGFVNQPWSKANKRRSFNQSLKFDNPQDAQYFGENYKQIAPMMKQYALGGLKSNPILPNIKSMKGRM